MEALPSPGRSAGTGMQRRTVHLSETVFDSPSLSLLTCRTTCQDQIEQQIQGSFKRPKGQYLLACPYPSVHVWGRSDPTPPPLLVPFGSHCWRHHTSQDTPAVTCLGIPVRPLSLPCAGQPQVVLPELVPMLPPHEILLSPDVLCSSVTPSNSLSWQLSASVCTICILPE